MKDFYLYETFFTELFSLKIFPHKTEWKMSNSHRNMMTFIIQSYTRNCRIQNWAKLSIAIDIPTKMPWYS